jgi:iron complex transport system permease protein
MVSAAPSRSTRKRSVPSWQAPAVHVLLGVMLVAVAAASLIVGTSKISVAEVLRGLWTGTGVEGLIMRDIRLPRLLLSVSIGGMLGLAGAAMQALLRNPLAEPAVLGAPQAAAFGAVAVLYSGLAGAYSFALPAASMGGALASIILVVLVAGRSATTLTLILAGLAISSLAGAATSLAINLSPNPFAVTEIVFWLMGSLEDRALRHVVMSLPFILVAAALLFSCGPGYRALTLGEETAASLGIDLRRLRLLTIAGVAIGVGAGVSVSGAIGFVGLAAPHFVRRFVQGDPQRVLVPATCAGAVLLTAADVLVRLVPATSEIRIGVVTAILGVPMFLWIVSRQVRQGGLA